MSQIDHEAMPVVEDDPTLRPRNLRIQSVNEEQLDPLLKQKLDVLLMKKQ